MIDLLYKVLLPMCLTGCLFALGVLLVFPLLRRLGARWRRRALLAAVTLFILPLPLLFAGRPAQPAAPRPTLPQVLQQAAPTAPAYQAGQALNTAARQPAGGEESEAGTAPSVSLPGVLGGLYLAGFGLFTCITGARYALFARRLRRGCTPVPPQSRQAALLRELCQEMAIRRPPRLYHSHTLPSPLLVGLLRPRIILPASAEDPAQLEWALRHELTHLQQRDLPAKLFLLAVSAVHWWCPALPALRRAFSLACEEGCDERVTAGLSGGQRRDYARTLLHFADGALPYATAPLALPAKNLRRRLQRLLRPARPSRALQAVGLTLLAVLLCTGLLMGCSFAAGAAAPSATSSAPPSSFAASLSGASAPEDASAAQGDTATSGYAWPLPGYTGISREYMGEKHRGVDLNAPEGTPILPTAAGCVIEAANHWSYGNYVMVDHGGGIVSLYAHCAELMVQVGDMVTQNTLLATVGDTGVAASKHLHFEIQLDGEYVDPMDYVTAPDIGDAPAPGDASPAQSDTAASGYAWPLPDYTGMSRGYMGSAHRGLDLNAPVGTPIVACAAGTVATAEYHWSYGYYVIIDHGGGVQSLYAQCEELQVEVGQTVEQNNVIATVGSTGVSTGPHLHFEIQLDGEAVDPIGYVSLPPAQKDAT